MIHKENGDIRYTSLYENFIGYHTPGCCGREYFYGHGGKTTVIMHDTPYIYVSPGDVFCCGSCFSYIIDE